MSRRLAVVILACSLAACTIAKRPDRCAGILPTQAPPRLAGTGFIRQQPPNRKLLVFVHGLMGDARGTWTARNGSYWPAIVAQDPELRDYDIYIYSYPTALTGDCTLLPDLAEEMRLRLEPLYASYDEVDFVAHSMGGVVIREMLLTYGGVYLDKTRVLAFFGTPGGGSELADKASLITDCVDDLRQVRVNSFLKQQIKKWQQGRIAERVHTMCGVESNGLVVDSASTMLLCEESATIFGNHFALVKPGCGEDLSHIVLKKALRHEDAAPRAKLVDPDLVGLLEEQQTLRTDNRALEFWAALGGDGQAELLLRLQRAPAEERLNVLRFAMTDDTYAQRLKGQARAIARAVVGTDAALRRRVRDEWIPALRRKAATPTAREALDVLVWELGFRPPVDSPRKDELLSPEPRAELLARFSRWPQLAREFDTVITGRAAGQIPSAHLDRLRQLAGSERAAVRDAYLAAMRQSYFLAKAFLCDAADVLGVREELRAIALDDATVDGWTFWTRDCIGEADLDAALTRSVAGLGKDRGVSSRSLTGFIWYAAPAELESVARKLLAAVPPEESYWHSSLLGFIIDRRPELAPMILERFLTVLPRDQWTVDLALALAEHAEPADAPRLWNAIRDIAITEPHLVGTLARTTRLLRPHVSPAARREMAERLWGLVAEQRSAISEDRDGDQTAALGVFAWELTDDEVAKILSQMIERAEPLLGEPKTQGVVFEVLAIADVIDQRLPIPRELATRLETMRGLKERLAYERMTEQMQRFGYRFPFPGPPQSYRMMPPPPGSMFFRGPPPSENPRDWLLAQVRSVRAGRWLNAGSDAARIASVTPACCGDKAVLDEIASLPDRQYQEKQEGTTLDEYDDAAALFVASLPAFLTTGLQTRLRASIDTGEPAAHHVRLLLATGCRAENRAAAAREAAVRILATTDDPREARSAAVALASCAVSGLPPGAEGNLAQLFDRARTADDIRRLLDALDSLKASGERWQRATWTALSAILTAHPRTSGESIKALLQRAPAPSVESAAEVLRLPMLSEDLERIVLRQAGRRARAYFASYWDFVEWLAAPPA